MIMVGKFLDECCLLGASLSVPLPTLWQRYQAWCRVGRFVADMEELRSHLADMHAVRIVTVYRDRIARVLVHGVGLR